MVQNGESSPGLGSGLWTAVKTFIQRRAPQLQKYEIEGDDDEHIGVGQAGTRVYRCCDKSTGKKYAVKVVSKKMVDKKKMNEIRREARVMRELSQHPHKNLVQLVDFFEDRKPVGNLYIVMELMEGGELFDQISNRGSFTEHEACQVVVQVAEALLHMHNLGYVHRDLKPENLLCATKDSLDLIKLCDFGMTRQIDNSTATTPCGTVTYVAPEVIIMRSDDLKKRGYGQKVDVWSLGVILYVLLSGRPPFYDNTSNGIMQRIRLGEFGFPKAEWDYISIEAKDLIEQCLVVDPDMRYSVDEFLAHPWITKAKEIPIIQSPRLQSPVVLRESSLPLNEFFKLLLPRLNIPSSPKPVPISWNNVSLDVPRDQQFYHWTVGEAALEYEVPGYYKSLRAIKFGAGPGLLCVGWHDELNCDVAIRKISKVSTDRDLCYRLSQECSIMKKLSHENIHAVQDGFVSPSEDVYFAYDMFDYTLRELLLERTISQEDIQLLTCYLFRGLNYIHETGLIHRDIKPSTLFVNMSFGKVCALKIGDFSKARTRPEVFRDHGDSRHYRAPELQLQAFSYDSSVDMWAAGCILGEMQIRKLLFAGEKKECGLMDSIIQLIGVPSPSLLQDEYKCDKMICDMYIEEASTTKPAVSFAKRFPKASPECVELLQNLLQYDAKARWTAAQALSHAYLMRFKASEPKTTSPTPFFSADFDERPRGVNWKLHLYKLLESFHSDAFDDRPLCLWEDGDDETSNKENYTVMSSDSKLASAFGNYFGSHENVVLFDSDDDL